MTYAAIEPSTPSEEPSTFSDYVLPGAIVLVLICLLLADWLPVIVQQWQRRAS